MFGKSYKDDLYNALLNLKEAKEFIHEYFLAQRRSNHDSIGYHAAQRLEARISSFFNTEVTKDSRTHDIIRDKPSISKYKAVFADPDAPDNPNIIIKLECAKSNSSEARKLFNDYLKSIGKSHLSDLLLCEEANLYRREK